MYKIELTCGPGWEAPPIGRAIALASNLSFAEVESIARSMLEVAREAAAPLTPDGYRITYEGVFRCGRTGASLGTET